MDTMSSSNGLVGGSGPSGNLSARLQPSTILTQDSSFRMESTASGPSAFASAVTSRFVPSASTQVPTSSTMSVQTRPVVENRAPVVVSRPVVEHRAHNENRPGMDILNHLLKLVNDVKEFRFGFLVFSGLFN